MVSNLNLRKRSKTSASNFNEAVCSNFLKSPKTPNSEITGLNDNIVEFSDSIKFQNNQRPELSHIDAISDSLSARYGLKRNAPMDVGKLKANHKIKYARGKDRLIV